MDWRETTEPLIVAFPRGSGLLGGQPVVADSARRWTSRYGGLVIIVYGIGTVDGVNEHGLAAPALYLKSTDVGSRDPPDRHCTPACRRNACSTRPAPSPRRSV